MFERLRDFDFLRWLRLQAVPILIFAVKILTAVVTARATYRVTGDLLAVALLDGAMLGFWLALDYGGDRQAMRDFRPFATAGVWGLYLWQLIIGWSAEQTVAAFAIRTAASVMIAASTWQYLMNAYREWRKRRASRQAPDVYAFAQTKFHARLRKSVTRAVRGLGSHMDVLIMDQLHDSLPDMLSDKFTTVVDVRPQMTAVVGRLPKSARHARLLSEYVGQPTAELAALFGVSERTIERDLVELDLLEN